MGLQECQPQPAGVSCSVSLVQVLFRLYEVYGRGYLEGRRRRRPKEGPDKPLLRVLCVCEGESEGEGEGEGWREREVGSER